MAWFEQSSNFGRTLHKVLKFMSMYLVNIFRVINLMIGLVGLFRFNQTKLLEPFVTSLQKEQNKTNKFYFSFHMSYYSTLEEILKLNFRINSIWDSRAKPTLAKSSADWYKYPLPMTSFKLRKMFRYIFIRQFLCKGKKWRVVPTVVFKLPFS